MTAAAAAAASAAAANPYATLAGFQSGIQFNQPMLQTFQAASSYPIIQTAAPQFQLTPQGLIQTPPQQFGYLTPQGIIVNQPAPAAPGYFPASPFAPSTTSAAHGQIIYSPQAPTYLPAAPTTAAAAAAAGYPMSTLLAPTPISVPTPIPPPSSQTPLRPGPTSEGGPA